MRFIGNLIVRLVAIGLGLVFAYLCCGLFIGMGFYAEMVRPAIDPPASGGEGVIAILSGLIWSPIVAMAATGPALALIAFAEPLRLRGLFANLVIGAIAALLSFWLATGRALEPNISQGALAVLLATGFVGGFAYWLVAGRNAGRWLDPPPSVTGVR